MRAQIVSIMGGESKQKSPVTGSRIVAGLVPCNVIAEEILTDHPKRFRAMFVEGANPAHSLADSQRMREAMRALEALGRVATPDRKVHLALPDLLATLREVLAAKEEARDESFPFVLSAGERRAFTANTIIRDPSWRKKDAEGALRIHPDDAAEIGVAKGGLVMLTTKRGSVRVSIEISDSMQRGHISLPNGLGVTYPSEDGASAVGVAPNELTSIEDRDPFVGTPWHKNVPARVERI